MRHAIRLSAMMSLPAIWVFSHDSIGIGTNGPTHQPVECIPSLRAIPNMWTMRPCDPVEAATKLGWEHFVGEDGGIIGMESFGASGAVQAVYEKFGITAAQVVKEVEARL